MRSSNKANVKVNIALALVVQAYTFAHQYAYSWIYEIQKKNLEALKLAILSSAQINPGEYICSEGSFILTG